MTSSRHQAASGDTGNPPRKPVSSESPSGDNGHGIADQLANVEVLLQQASLLFLHLARLARTEARLALASVPDIIRLSLLLVPLAILSWITFSLFVGWSIYVLWGSSVGAVFSLFLIQLLPCVLIAMRLKALTEHLRFPHTAKQWRDIREQLIDE